MVYIFTRGYAQNMREKPIRFESKKHEMIESNERMISFKNLRIQKSDLVIRIKFTCHLNLEAKSQIQ